MKFSELPLPRRLLTGIEEAGFQDCTPIQERALPLALAGKDVAGQAQTGTGKTAAFLITLFTKLLSSKASGNKKPRALILAPTRELALQIERDARLIGGHCGLSIQAVYGGVDYAKQRNALHKGKDIVIATPGRLIDYMKQKVCNLKWVEALVIDEADRMFDMGFIVDLRFILQSLPPHDKRQSMMFSATLNRRVMELAYEFMNMPEKVAVTPEKMTAERVDQLLYHVARKEKFPLLLGVLRQDSMKRVMIFVNTKREGEFLLDRLSANGFTAHFISGDVNQKKRVRILDEFRNGSTPIMIATDVASRGLHIDGISHVINYDLPQDCEDYVHRIGRTARAGAEGKAISLADEDGVLNLTAIEKYIKCKIPSEWADDELFVDDYNRVARPKYPLGTSKCEGSNSTSAPHSRRRSAPRKKNENTASAPKSIVQDFSGETPKPAEKRRRKPRKSINGNKHSRKLTSISPKTEGQP